MTQHDKDAILEEEVIILRHSGEIPEIALYSSLYYLQEDEDGPRISLCDEELSQLYDAALARAREIVLRDLDPENRDLSLYRGVARSIINWQRLQSFCHRINRSCPGFDKTVSQAFLSFLERECHDIQQSNRTSSVNCTAQEIKSFCEKLKVDPDLLPDGWMCLCRD